MTSAFQYSSVPFSLVLDIERIPPSFRSTPRYYLLIAHDEIQLEARFELALDHGTLDTVAIAWDGAAEHLWSVETTGAFGEEIRSPSIVAGEEAEERRKWIARPLQVISGRSMISLRATRPIDDSDMDDLVLPLPGVVASRVLPGQLIIATADDVEATIVAEEPATLEPSPAAGNVGDPLPEMMASQPVTEHRIVVPTSEPDPRILVSRVVRQRVVETSSTVMLSGLGGAIEAQQIIRYDVEFGRLNRVRLHIPAGLAQQIPTEFAAEALSFRLNDETPLTPRWQGNDVTLELPSPILGPFTIVIDTRSVPNDAAQAQEHVAVPIIQSLDQTFRITRLIMDDGQTVSAIITDPSWTRLSTVADGVQWVSSTSPDEVVLHIDRSFSLIPQQFTIERAFIEIAVADTGTTRVVAHYLLPAELTKLAVKLPEGAIQTRFLWGPEEVQASSLVRVSGAENTFVLHKPPSSPSGGNWLTISYDTQSAALDWTRRQTVVLPAFGEHTWVGQSYWKIELPRSHHLFRAPEGLQPGYEWQRNFVFWQRTTTPESLAAWNQVGAGSSQPVTALKPGGHLYLLSSTGLPGEVSFRSMSKSMIVLIGAGVTLISGFLLLKLPRLLGIWGWLLIGFGLSIAMLWYLEPVQLLLQPAVFGLILPICAALLDRRTTRRPGIRSKSPALDSASRQDESSLLGQQLGAAPVATTLLHPPMTSDSGAQR